MSEKIKLTEDDINLGLRRKEVILIMIEAGLLDENIGIDMWETQFRPSIVQEERNTMLQVLTRGWLETSDHEDSPLGRLVALQHRLDLASK